MRKFSDVLLDPSDVAVTVIDHQPQMYFGVESFSRSAILNSVLLLAKAAKIFQVPCIYTTVEAKEFSGYLLKKIQEVYPDQMPIDRTSINAWEDDNFKSAIEQTGKNSILIAGLWTEACVLFPALSMTADGYKVYVVADACGGATKEAHDMALQRMVQAGVIPVTAQQVCLEFQRDWANKETYDAVMQLVQEHGGAYGMGVEYAQSMLQQ